MAPSRNRGELESQIMNILWDSAEPLTAKEVQSQFTVQVPAITTLITVLDRLRIKGTVTRAATGGRSQAFSAVRSRVDDIAHAMSRALSTAPDQSAALLMFAGSLSDDDRAVLRKALDS
jgi:predicted transcriptional regulator